MEKPKQITVFGATGFIGRHIVRRLVKAGAIVRVPTRDMEKALPLKVLGDVGQVILVPCSPRRDADVRTAIAASDAVVNLLGILFEKGSNTFQQVHVETAARIARASKELGVGRFVQVSALGANIKSQSSYARSKALGEQAVQTFFPAATILRPSIVFGAEDNFFNQFAHMAGVLPFLPLIGGGQTKFQPVYVADVADAVIASLQRDDAPGRIYELGGPQAYTFQALLQYILDITHRRCGFVSLPWGIAKLQASLMELMPTPLLTRDQVELLKTDNVLSGDYPGLGTLGVARTPLEAIVPSYLARFRAS